MNADQILLSFANTRTANELPGVYFLCGFDARRITAVSQQHRAISLVEALIRKGRLRPATKVGVLGGGIAGCTFAYWAACHGAHVTIYEKSGQLLDVWERASHRWLHPGLFNWPNQGWDQPETNLPCLNWSFNTAQEVGRSLRQKMDRLAEDLGEPYLRIQAGRAYHIKASPSRRPAVDCPNGLAEDHDLVVVAVGNGDYPGGGSGPAYWDGNADNAFFDQLERHPATRVSVVGNGDGGIMDVLRMKTPVTDERALLDFLAQWRQDDASSLERVEDVVRSHESSPGMKATAWTSVVQAMGSTGAGIFKRELARRASWQKHLKVDWYCKRQKLNPGASALLRTLLVGFMEADTALVAFREQEFSRSKQGNAAGKVVERVIRKRPIQHLDQAAAHPGGAASRLKIVGLAGSLSGFQEGDFFAGWYLFSKESTDRGQQAEPVLGGQRMQPAALLKAFEEEMAKSCARVAVPILPFSRNPDAGEGLVDSNLLLLSVHTMLRVVRHLDSRESKSEPLVRSQTIQSAPQPFFEAARPGDEAESQIVLMGDGGRGKTTLTGFLASSLLMQPRALADLKERDPDVHAQVVECRRHWDGFLPVVVRLRDLGKRNLNVLESAEELVLSALFRSSSGYETDLRDVPIIRPRHRVFESFRESLGVAIQGRRLLLIIDGMDEVNVASAKLVAALFGRTSRGLSAFKPSQVIIAARTSSVLNVDRGWYGLLRWPLLEIEPLSADWPSKKESQQYAFALRYFRCLSVEEPKPMTQAMIDHVRAITGDLMTAVADRDVADLAKEPILLASFARLYARHAKIPATRVEVLHGIMDLLMDEWDSARDIEFTVKILATEQKLSPEIPKRVLGRIASGCLLEPPDPSAAFQFMQKGSPRALRELLESEFREISTVEHQEDAMQMADAMAERFGILRRTDTSKRQETSGAATPPAKSRPWMSASPAPDPTFLEFSLPLYASCLAGLFWASDKALFQQVLDFMSENGSTVLWDHVRPAVALGLAGLELGLHRPKVPGTPSPADSAWPLLVALAEKAATTIQTDKKIARELFALIAAAGQELKLLQSSPQKSDARDWTQVRDRMAQCFGNPSLAGPTRAAAGRALAWVGDSRSTMATLGDREPSKWSHIIEPRHFDMGSKLGEDAFSWEQPRFSCSLVREPFYLGIFPVTTAQFRMFEQEGYTEAALERYWTPEGAEFARRGLDARSYELIADIEFRKRYRNWVEGEAFPLKGRRVLGQDYDAPNAPVVGVSWHEAVAFCRWVNGTLTSEELGLPQGWKVRLPTEAEWELAASYRGGKKCVYPWGNDPDVARRANCNKSGIGRPSAVGSFGELGRAECGAEDMIGNVGEWCSTGWTENYQGHQDVPHVRDELADGGSRARQHLETEMLRVVRGGAWLDDPRGCRSAYRYWDHPSDRDAVVGFRLAASPISEFWSLRPLEL